MDGLDFLRELNKDLWDNPARKDLKVQARRILTAQEIDLIFQTIEAHNLMTDMFSANMFGGYGMDVYQHEPYPGTGPQFIFRMTEYELPPEMNAKFGKASGGSGSNDAWKLFSKYTHSQQNKEWLAMYKMEAPKYRSYYDY